MGVIDFLRLFFFLPQLGGCGILGVGVWLAVTQGKFATLSISFPSLSAASLFMVTGSVIMVVGFIGCLGAVTEHRCLLLTFFVVLLIIFLLEIISMVLFFTYNDNFHKYAQEDLKKGLSLYQTEGNLGLTNAWDIVQTEFRCCGVKNYTDWLEMRNSTLVPHSCCMEHSPSCQSNPGTWWKDPTLTLCQNTAAMGSSKQMPRTLKIKIVEAHKAGAGYKKIAKRFQVALSSVRHLIKKWQLPGSVEVKIRSGRPSKILVRAVRRIAREANKNPHLTAKDLQKDLADSGVVVHCSTVQKQLEKYGLNGRVIRRKPLLCPHHKIQRQKYTKELLNKSDAFWKQVLTSSKNI
ncbi:unnamed protein product [Ranitomeya imitator]|uniref:Tetraspanin n=1 Tax=Ranitomeya imitator TaxID=111125 RepID=A0ABN9LP55_9NEOB|nr:unnamed protein product [Ranitomeya imitator]